MKIIPTKDLTRAQWLELRRQGIGGSDVAAILGLSKWRTALEVWQDKTATAPADDREPSQAARATEIDERSERGEPVTEQDWIDSNFVETGEAAPVIPVEAPAPEAAAETPAPAAEN